MSDRPTPETDEATVHVNDACEFINPPDWEWVVTSNFAGNLECERDEAREQLDRICRDGFGYQDTISLEPCADYVLRKLTEERELARELLIALKDQHNFSRQFSNSSHNSRFAKMQRDTESLLAKAKEVLP